MAVTTTDLISELGQRIGPFVALVNLPSAISWALREMGHTTASAFSVVDADLVTIPDADINELLDFAQYSAAERVLDNLDDVQLAQISVKEDPESLRRLWRERLDTLYRKLQRKYSYGLPTLTGGVVEMDFQAQRSDLPPTSW